MVLWSPKMFIPMKVYRKLLRDDWACRSLPRVCLKLLKIQPARHLKGYTEILRNI